MPLLDLLFLKEGKLGHAKVGAAVGQKAFDFHRPDGGAGSGKGGGAAVAAFPCYRHTGHQKGNGSAFWREREVLHRLFLHLYFRTGEAVCPGRGGINFIIAVREFTPGNVCVYPVRCVRDYRYLYIRNFAPERWPAGNPETGFTNCDSSPTKTAVLELHEKGDDTYFTPCFGKRPLEELYDITTDPECMKNLASDPAFEKERGYYWEVLQSFLRETGDPRIFGNGDVFEQYPHSKIGMHAWAHYLAGDFQPQTY